MGDDNLNEGPVWDARVPAWPWHSPMGGLRIHVEEEKRNDATALTISYVFVCLSVCRLVWISV